MIEIEHVTLQSAAVDITPAPIDTGDLLRCAFVTRFTAAGTLSGNLLLEVSANKTLWVLRSTTAVAAGADKEVEIETGHRYVRWRWTFSAGTGNLEILAKLKGAG